jgi:hypothetical protein
VTKKEATAWAAAITVALISWAWSMKAQFDGNKGADPDPRFTTEPGQVYPNGPAYGGPGFGQFYDH